MNELTTFSLVLDLLNIGEANNVNDEKYIGYKFSLYINGVENKSSYINKEQWSSLKEELMGKTDTIVVGMLRNYDSAKGDYFYEYGKMILKNCLFYTRPLSDTEIKLNYDTRLAYDKDNVES